MKNLTIELRGMCDSIHSNAHTNSVKLVEMARANAKLETILMILTSVALPDVPQDGNIRYDQLISRVRELSSREAALMQMHAQFQSGRDSDDAARV